MTFSGHILENWFPDVVYLYTWFPFFVLFKSLTTTTTTKNEDTLTQDSQFVYGVFFFFEWVPGKQYSKSISLKQQRSSSSIPQPVMPAGFLLVSHFVLLTYNNEPIFFHTITRTLDRKLLLMNQIREWIL